MNGISSNGGRFGIDYDEDDDDAPPLSKMENEEDHDDTEYRIDSAGFARLQRYLEKQVCA